MARKDSTKKNTKRDGVALGLYWMYVLFLLGAIFLFVRIITIQTGYKPSAAVKDALTPGSRKEIIEPSRGAILAQDGRMLAMSLPIYNIYMDCTVMKGVYATKENGDELEQEWMAKAQALSEGLAREVGGKSAEEYFRIISEGRENGRKYVKICTGIERKTFEKISKLPLFCEGQYQGGMIVQKETIRKYPYGKLARRTIGFVRNNSEISSNTHIGIEGKYDAILHGKNGVEWMRVTDAKRRVHNNDSTYIKAEDGLNIRTTLNVDFQDIADAALREQIEGDYDVEGGCVILMDVKTGAVRAMVNLLRDSTTNRLEESMNLAVGRLGEPGSVFKTTTLMTLLEDKKVKSLSETIPTNRGIIPGYPVDQHIWDYERDNKVKEISILKGFEMSSNYMFRYLAVTNYGKRPKEMTSKLYMYKLGEAFDFDLEGLETPRIPSPDSPAWSGTDLGSIAIGYSVSETPLHIITFYNGIANKGRLMKPYLVESIEEHGIVREKRGPSILNGSICSPATADTLIRALKGVTEEGTAAYRLKSAKYQVAGKTGTSRIVLPNGQYEDAYGRKKNQGTFVGFFPADNPKYSIIVTVYSTLSIRNFYGGTYPAAAVRTIVDKLWAMEPQLPQPKAPAAEQKQVEK